MEEGDEKTIGEMGVDGQKLLLTLATGQDLLLTRCSIWKLLNLDFALVAIQIYTIWIDVKLFWN